MKGSLRFGKLFFFILVLILCTVTIVALAASHSRKIITDITVDGQKHSIITNIDWDMVSTTLKPTITPIPVNEELKCFRVDTADSIYGGTIIRLELENAKEGVNKFDVFMQHIGSDYYVVNTEWGLYNTEYKFEHTDTVWQFYLDYDQMYYGLSITVVAEDGTGRTATWSGIAVDGALSEGYMQSDV